jgi:hypothetical protein
MKPNRLPVWVIRVDFGMFGTYLVTGKSRKCRLSDFLDNPLLRWGRSLTERFQQLDLKINF